MLRFKKLIRPLLRTLRRNSVVRPPVDYCWTFSIDAFPLKVNFNHWEEKHEHQDLAHNFKEKTTIHCPEDFTLAIDEPTSKKTS